VLPADVAARCRLPPYQLCGVVLVREGVCRLELRQNVDDDSRAATLSFAQTYSVYSRYLVEPPNRPVMSARTNL